MSAEVVLLQLLAVVLDDGADAAHRLEDAPLHAALSAMAETAVTLAEDLNRVGGESAARQRYAQVRLRHGCW